MLKLVRTKPAAKSRPKTKSRTPAARRAARAKKKSAEWLDSPEGSLWPDMSMAEWWDSPEGSLWLDMSCELEDVVLKDVGLDARRRKFLWPDAGPLDLDQSARRIHQQYPDFPEDKTKDFLIYWIQQCYEPKGYSESQIDELERLTEQWAEDVIPGEK
jgi:hypothetical protein